MTAIVQRFSVQPFFRWYDLWIGAYWDRIDKVLYVCPVPMLGLKIKMPYRREPEVWCNCADWDSDRNDNLPCPVHDKDADSSGPSTETK